MSRGRRAGPPPAQRRCDYLGYQLDRPQDERMRRIDRMRLNGQVGGAGQYRVRSQRPDHIIRVADMAMPPKKIAETYAAAPSRSRIAAATANSEASVCDENGT